MALRIGLTGGIGSGKSTVAELFGLLGIPVYNADDAAKRLMNTDKRLRQEIVQHFGTVTYVNGSLDRKYLASVVFNDPEKLNLLNSIVHPATIRDAEQWFKVQIAPYVIKEAAVLVESGVHKMLDYVVGVSSPEELRMERVMKRDGLSREEVLKRMEKQMDENEKMSLCDFVLVNDETRLLIPQVLELHRKLTGLSMQSGNRLPGK
ncbi:MAG: dephospho-CoA kinase [Sphingobacteriales bacterium UTBCD1]|nr:MAG: dephospho-CoA kinase [Sphingobacteriales bacterium UTBCD1]